ncbi:hypothetical protein [Paenibacillus sp. tmac-D7]|uniref:hypothetical protein n=1 Tax=Paenibacillus sp. tmac-D7 TaxID=2591462 RepID=UPI001142109F|nr:hypothetical protein [Paenibacillus sp. tmac-D7]
MKLLTVQDAIAKVNAWFHIPVTHDVIHSGIYRNSEPNQTPYYQVELEWNKQGEPALDDDGLVNKQTIRAELDAVSGHMIAFYRHEFRKNGKDQKAEMDNALYAVVFPYVLQWIGKLGLPISESELELKRKQVIDGDLYELDYGRQYAGIPVRNFGTFNIKLDQAFGLVHLFCRWDACIFDDRVIPIAPDAFKLQFDSKQLMLYYMRMLSSEHPYYMWKEDTFEAVSGRLVSADRGELTEMIDLQPTKPQRRQPVKFVRKPIFSADQYEALRVSDHVTEVDPCAPHPFFPVLSDEEVIKAKDIAVSYLQQHMSEETCQYAFIRKEGHEVARSMQGNRLQVEIQRLYNGIPVIGGAVRLFIDRDSWELNHVMDGLEFWKMAAKSNVLAYKEPRIAMEEAWSKLKGKVELNLHYRLEEGVPANETKRAILVYTLDCDWICNAVTGEVTKLALPSTP